MGDVYTLENDRISLALNERGELAALALKGGKNIISRPAGLFRAVFHYEGDKEAVAPCEAQHAVIARADDALSLTVHPVMTQLGALDVTLHMRVRLDGEKVVFSSSIENNAKARVADWVYPCVGMIAGLGGEEKMDLLYPQGAGMVYHDVGGYLRGLTQSREKWREITNAYPAPMSMQWEMLRDGGTCLYLSGRDELLHASAIRARGSAQGDVALEMDKMPLIGEGQTWACPDYVLWLYEGSWMQGAREYAQWAQTWRSPSPKREWARRMNGYFLVINKQQYGDEIWPYDTIPRLYDLAQAHGCDTLGLFGWYDSGHDNQYPDLKVSPSMGGADGLRDGISSVHEAGGHVTLYYQGHLMDITSDFYAKKGRALEGRNIWGTPYIEFYPKFCRSDFLRHFSRKAFSTVCPSCPEWHDLMAERADWIHAFGADGVLYDQIGGMEPRPCFNAAHPHMNGSPALSFTQGRRALHRRIRAQVDSHPGFGYMTEHICDAYSELPDAIHGIGVAPTPEGGQVEVMSELFRYVFPETLITERNPKPFISRRDANYTFFYGLKFEMELRYATDRAFIEADEGREDRTYVKKLADLRRRHEDYLLLGTFRAEEGARCKNSAIRRAVYERADGKRALVLWNGTRTSQAIDAALEGVALTRWAGAEGEGDGVPAELPPESVIMLYEG